MNFSKQSELHFHSNFYINQKGQIIYFEQNWTYSWILLVSLPVFCMLNWRNFKQYKCQW